MELYRLVVQSDAITKGIVGLLVLISIINGAVILYKLFFFKRELRSMNSLLAAIDSSASRNELEFVKKTITGYETRYFFSSLLEAYDKIITPFGGSDAAFDMFENRGYAFLTILLLHAERGLTLLSISAITSPLIGLFGTVWGLIHSFISISQERTADLLVVAPGIAEALITTLAGLVVAIPATIFFHYFSSDLRKLENSATLCIDSLARIIQKAQMGERV